MGCIYSESLQWFCFQISSNAKYFFLSCPRNWDLRLIVVIVYYFKIWNKKNTLLLLLLELLAVTRDPCILKHPILFLASFSHQYYLLVFYWNLRPGKSSQMSKTLLSILTDLSNVVVWMVSARPPIFNSSSPLIKSLGIVPSEPTTMGIAVIFMFQNFFSSLTRSKYLSLFSFVNYPWVWFSGQN